MTSIKKENFFKRPLAITDIETTGLDDHIHDIIDIGLILADQDTLEILDTFETKIKPENIKEANPESLKINGYNEKDWQNSLSLKKGLEIYVNKVKGAVFCAHNVTFDWGFLKEAFRKSGVQDTMDYHRLELFSVAYAKLNFSGLKNFNLSTLAEFLGIEPEPEVHRALNGARLAYEVYKKLLSH